MKLQNLSNDDLPAVPPEPLIVSYGDIDMTESVGLFKSLGILYPGDGITAKYPDIMEEYGQSYVPSPFPFVIPRHTNAF